MIESKNPELEFLFVKIVQSGEIKKIPLNELNLSKKFNALYIPMLKKLKLKKNDAFLTNESGQMFNKVNFDETVEDVVKEFGSKLKLYYEKIM